MNILSFLLALLALILSVVTVIVNKLDLIAGAFIVALSLSILLLTWVPVVASRRVP